MTIATATPQQLAELSNFVVLMRAQISALAVLMSRMNALNASWVGTISSIVGTPAGLTITDSTNLAGAVPLTDTQVQTLVTDIQQILTTYNTPGAQQLYAMVAGPGNIVS